MTARCRRFTTPLIGLAAIFDRASAFTSLASKIGRLSPRLSKTAIFWIPSEGISAFSSRPVRSIMSARKASAEHDMTVPAPPLVVKGLLLDMDGTLTDSDTLHFEAYRETLMKITPLFNDGEPITREFYDGWMSGNSNLAIVEKLFPDMPAAAQTALWKSKEVTYREISTKLTPLPGLLAFLENCEAAGLAMIVVTNAPRVDAVHTLTVLGLFERFGEAMVIGYECARAKPHADPYLEGLSRLGLTADVCVAFEDSVNGVASAVSAGLYTVGVCGASREKLQGVGAGLCVVDFLDSRLPDVIGLGVTKN